MAKITQLTPAQTAEVAGTRARWFAIGASCEPADRALAEEGISDAYRAIGRAPPRFVWVGSPRSAVAAIGALRRYDTVKVQSHIELSPPEVRIADALSAMLDDRTRVECAVSAAFNQASPPEQTYHWGQADAFWIAFYDYCQRVLEVKYEATAAKHLAIHMKVSSSCGWWYPFENICVVCERPLELHWRQPAPEMLHRDGGPAIVMRDGWSVWILNNVRVPKWLAETPEAQIDPARIKEIMNAEVRREFIRKVGIERIAAALNAETVDEVEFENDTGRHSYALLSLEIGEERWLYLKMENPSLRGTYHLEGVPNSVESVRAALLFRNGLKESQIAEDGAEWQQQGDVLLFPAHAKKFKLFPKVLT